jgi:hypothetical protein
MTTLGNLSDGLGMFIGFLLTLLVFSYLFGDNALFRFAIHVFIGVSAGYVLSVTTVNVIGPKLLQPLFFGAPMERLLALVPLVLSLLLLAKLFPRLSGLGTPVMALLAGVGGATAVGGALLGTLLPQANATIGLFGSGNQSPGLGFFNGVIVLLGTALSLAYFQFNVRNPRPAWATAMNTLGQAIIALALGVVFAGVYMAALTAMIARLNAIVEFIRWFFFPAA